MTNLEKIDSQILSAIRSYMDYDDAGPEQQKAIDLNISHSTVEELLDKYLNWEGIIGYTSSIIQAVDNLRSAQEPNLTDILIDYIWDDELLSYQEEHRLPEDEDEAIIEHALNNDVDAHIFCVLARLHVNGGV